MQENNELIQELNSGLPVSIPAESTPEELTKKLSEYINYLIVHDFNQLVSILYRLDVSENKLKQMLQDSSAGDAGNIIAALIIERQLQKIKSRRQYNRRDDTISDDEKW
jgi:hypothetical protein